MGWIEVLSGPAVGNLLILIAAIVGVGGSYYIYHIRIEDRRNSARRALKSELESMTFFTQWIEGSGNIPSHSVCSTRAYDANIENIGLLTNEEIDSLTSFYSSAILIDDILKSNRETVLQAGLVQNADDRGREQREKAITSRLDQLAVKRWKTLQILKKNLDEPYESPERLDIPESAGGTLHEKHPILRSHGDKLLCKGYIEQSENEDDVYRLTESGEEYFRESINEEMGF